MVDSITPIHLWVVSPDALVRQALSWAWDGQHGVVVWGESEASIEAIRGGWGEERPDVLLWDFQDNQTEREVWATLQIPVLALVAQPGQALTALLAGAKGALFRDGDVERMASAIQSMMQGMVVIDETFAATILQEQDNTPPSVTMVEELTPREEEVLELLAEGLSNKEIAQQLGVSEHTIKFHVNSIRGKLGAQTRTEAVVRAARLGLLHL